MWLNWVGPGPGFWNRFKFSSSFLGLDLSFWV